MPDYLLTNTDAPESMTKVYEDLKRSVFELMNPLVKALNISESILEKDVELLKQYPNHYIWIANGFYKLLEKNRIIRYFSDGDLIFCEDDYLKCGFSLMSEFGTKVFLIPKNSLLNELQKNSEKLKAWNEIREKELFLTTLICALYVQDVAANLGVKGFRAGDVIIEEESEAKEIFVMIQGSADVSINNVVVGKIESGEPFGEISFLCQQKRSAKVVATCNCIVQALSHENIIEAIKSKPQLMLTIAETLAKRVLKLNAKITLQKII